jgi:hypothetical protein
MRTRPTQPTGRLHILFFSDFKSLSPQQSSFQPQNQERSMSETWEQLYRSAFQELDAEKVPALCDRARIAINQRLTKISARTATGDEKERDQLFEALRSLLIHENTRRAPN